MFDLVLMMKRANVIRITSTLEEKNESVCCELV